MEKQRVRKKKYYILLCFLFLWIGIMGFLSSQDGIHTTNMSIGLARYGAKLVYENPSTEQINEIHLLIRKIAHIVLYLVLGMLVVIALEWYSRGKKSVRKELALVLFVIGCAYFDEWHKQFIVGRHNQISDMLLNIVGGMAGILLGKLAILLKRKRRM